MTVPHEYIVLTAFQSKAITGSLLGDGFLDKESKNASLRITRSINDIDYLKYEANIFYNFLTEDAKTTLVKTTSQFDKRTNKEYRSCYFLTQRNPVFTELSYKWYNNGIKVIPNDIELSNIAIAHWIADDGCISTSRVPYRFSLEISTQSFSEAEVDFLSSLLSFKYNEKFFSSPKIINNKKRFIIKAYDSACRVLFKDIDTYFKLYRKRIWDNPETRFYTNPPERQIEKVNLFVWRKIKMQEILDNYNSISLEDLKEQLKYNGKTHSRVFNSLFIYFPNKIKKEYFSGKCYFILSG